MALIIKFETKNQIDWVSLAPYTGYTIVKRPVGRGRYVYHGYKGQQYIAQGPSLDRAIEQVILWARKNS